MAEISRTEIFDVNINKIYDVIVDYESYPDFVDGVSEIEVFSQDEKGAEVQFTLNLIKKFSYTLLLTHEKPNRVHWELESSDLFKKSNGIWDLKEINENETEVKYSIDVEIKGFMPKSIMNSLTSKSLPMMMKSYLERAKNL